MNRLSCVTDAVGESSYFSYDSGGNLTSTKDPLWHGAAFDYDALGRLEAATDAEAATTYFFYDETGNRTCLKDALEQCTYYAYDGASRLTDITDALGATEYYDYDAGGPPKTYRLALLGGLPSSRFNAFAASCSPKSPSQL